MLNDDGTFSSAEHGMSKPISETKNAYDTKITLSINGTASAHCNHLRNQEDRPDLSLSLPLSISHHFPSFLILSMPPHFM